MTICLAATLALAACAARAGTAAAAADVPPSAPTSQGQPTKTPTTSQSPRPPRSNAPAGTKQIVVTPVTDRRSSPGWTVARQSQPTLDCGDAEASASTVSANVYACSQTYAYAVACWPGGRAGPVLCLRDPWSHQVVEMSYAGHLSPVRPPSRPTPLALQLSD